MGIPRTRDVRPPARTGGWRAVAILSVVLAVWLVASAFLPSIYLLGVDLTVLVAAPLIAGLSYALVSRLVRMASPNARSRERGAVVLLVWAAFLIPFGFQVVEYARVAGPATSALSAQSVLPDLAGLVGRSSDDVERSLGTDYGHDMDPAEGADAVRPWENAAARVVAYPLGVYSGWWSRPAVARAMGGPEGLWREPESLSREPSDGATVTVYYATDGRAIGVRLTLSPVEVTGSRVPGWSERMLRTCGLDGDLESAEPPPWAIAYSEAASATVNAWGYRRDGASGIGYNLRVLSAPRDSSGDRGGVTSADRGVLVVTVGRALVDHSSGAGESSAFETPSDAIGETAEQTSAVEATATFTERRFYAIVFSTGTDEAVMIDRAERINKRVGASGDASPAVVVERSGHLYGVADGDYWLIISSTGYEVEAEANARASDLSWQIGVVQDVVPVTKRCGDVTIRRIELEDVPQR